MAEKLKIIQGAQIDPRLIEQMLKLKGQNLSDQEVARRLLQDHPELHNADQKQALQQLMQQYGISPEQLKQFGRENNPVLPDQPMGPSVLTPGDQPLPETENRGPNSSALTPPIPPDGANPVPRGEGLLPGSQFDPEQLSRRSDPFPRMPPPKGEAIDYETYERRQRQFQAAARWWEENVGPLNETPALRQLLMEMFTGQSGDGRDAGSLGELLDNPSAAELGSLAERLSGWKLPSLGLGGKGGGMSNFAPPSGPSGSSFSGFNGLQGGGSGSWLPVIVLMAVAGLGLFLWWMWPKLMDRTDDGPKPLPGLGPWPVDPRSIADRDSLVKAFEYLSVLVCGKGARVWNHVTIAAALERAVPQAEALADPLARLYAVARYTPDAEPLPPGAIAEAREYLCELAGVPAA